MHNYIHCNDAILSRYGLGLKAFDTWFELSECELDREAYSFMRDDFLRALILESRHDDDFLASEALEYFKNVLGSPFSLADYIERKKIALASVQLGGVSDETAISTGILQSDSERSSL